MAEHRILSVLWKTASFSCVHSGWPDLLVVLHHHISMFVLSFPSTRLLTSWGTSWQCTHSFPLHRYCIFRSCRPQSKQSSGQTLNFRLRAAYISIVKYWFRLLNEFPLSVCLFFQSGRCCAAGGLPLPEGGLPHSLQETISGNWWCKTPLCPWQPGFFYGAAALGHSALSNHRSKDCRIARPKTSTSCH